MEPLHILLSSTKTKSQVLNWKEITLNAFRNIKDALANACLLSFPSSDASTCLVTDASDVDETWKPIAFFFKVMKSAEKCYSTFDKELLALYLAIKHFRHYVEGRHFHVLTDHKPLTYALNTHSDRYSPRQSQHLDYISQFTTNIRHLQGSQNVVADTLSHIEADALVANQPPKVNFEAIAEAQSTDKQLRALQSSPTTTLVIEAIPLANSSHPLYCDMSTGNQRLIVPLEWRRTIFDSLHGLSHPGIRMTQKLITSRYVWPGVNADVRRWAHSCIQCQHAKVHSLHLLRIVDDNLSHICGIR